MTFSTYTLITNALVALTCEPRFCFHGILFIDLSLLSDFCMVGSSPTTAAFAVGSLPLLHQCLSYLAKSRLLFFHFTNCHSENTLPNTLIQYKYITPKPPFWTMRGKCESKELNIQIQVIKVVGVNFWLFQYVTLITSIVLYTAVTTNWGNFLLTASVFYTILHSFSVKKKVG